MNTPEKALQHAGRMGRLDVAALLMTMCHVGTRLTEVADAAREGATPGEQIGSQLDGLCAMLRAGLLIRAETEVLEAWAAKGGVAC